MGCDKLLSGQFMAQNYLPETLWCHYYTLLTLLWLLTNKFNSNVGQFCSCMPAKSPWLLGLTAESKKSGKTEPQSSPSENRIPFPCTKSLTVSVAPSLQAGSTMCGEPSSLSFRHWKLWCQCHHGSPTEQGTGCSVVGQTQVRCTETLFFSAT